MFVYNVKILPSKKLLVFLAAASIVVSVVCVICMISVHSQVPDTATCDEIGTYSLKAETCNEQINFLKGFGLSPVPESAESRDIIIPSEFNPVYDEYNELQKSIGLDLSRYKGKSAKMITYELKNSKEKYAVMLIYKNMVIGAHLTNGEYGQKNKPLK